MRKILVLFLVLLIFNGVVAAKENDTVHLRAGRLKYIGDKIEISNGVTIIKGKYTIKAPRGKIYKEKNKAVLTDGISLKSNQGDINSQEMIGLLDEDKYIFKRDVKLFNKTNNDQEFQLSTSYLEMYGNEESFQTDQGVIIDYDNKEIKAKKAIYNDKEQTLVLENDVQIKEGNGDWIEGSRAVFYLDSKEDNFIIEKNVEVEMELSD
ncbi:MAG: lipopolysaccharide export system protein LptA [Candidatus Frackibacter sp. T328-2]|nr:MAG: lipopolysaccharide export system protein LptA [Candidatus Frackibacter sp. T328-2]